MILKMGVNNLQLGINKTRGMCNEATSTNPLYNSAAFTISKDTMLTVGTSQVSYSSFLV